MSTADGTVVGTTQVVDNGPRAKRWNLVLMGDGYQTGQLAQFANDVQAFVNTLFSTAPFDALQGAINVFRVDVSSTDSGADDPKDCKDGKGTTARTYFDASFCGDGIRRRLVVNDATALTVAGAQVPEWCMVMVVVNSTVYGGSGGAVGTFSLDPNANNIALHELGHMLGLADEYQYYSDCDVDTDRNRHPAVEPVAPNVTIDPSRATNKWRDLVASTTPMPTTKNADCAKCDTQSSPVGPSVVGAFEGANHYHCDVFRPQFSCRMRQSFNPFCAVCTRHIRQVLEPYVDVKVSDVVAFGYTGVHVALSNGDGSFQSPEPVFDKFGYNADAGNWGWTSTRAFSPTSPATARRTWWGSATPASMWR